MLKIFSEIKDDIESLFEKAKAAESKVEITVENLKDAEQAFLSSKSGQDISISEAFEAGVKWVQGLAATVESDAKAVETNAAGVADVAGTVAGDPAPEAAVQTVEEAQQAQLQNQDPPVIQG